MYEIGEEEMVVCPYNRYHLVNKIRIQKHIMKCKKNYPNIKLATCFYNYSHKLKPEDMIKHYETCSQKNKLEGSRYYGKSRDASGNASLTMDILRNHFFDMNSKIRFLSNISNSHTFGGDGPKVSSNFEEPDLNKADPFDENDSSSGDELEPLPLPKTTSIAFSGRKKQQNGFNASINTAIEMPVETESSQTSAEKEISMFKASKPLSPIITTSEESDVLKKMKNSKVISEDMMSHCCESIMSSVFDDSTTLKSEEIIFDNENDKSLLKSFDKCVKL